MKRCVFKDFLNDSEVSIFLISRGREFHAKGAQYEKERWPNDFVRILGIFNLYLSAEDRRERAGV